MSATYSFGSRWANSARRVADSKRMGSTPVASGSRVPAWPTRLAPVTSRRRLTAEKEVAPAGLLRLRTPDRIDAPEYRFAGCPQNCVDRFAHRSRDLGAGGARVPAAAEQGAEGGR